MTWPPAESSGEAPENYSGRDAVALGRMTKNVVRQNVTFAIAVIATLVAATLLGYLRLPLAVVGHEGSTVLVVLNGLRLLGTAGPYSLDAAAAPGASRAGG